MVNENFDLCSMEAPERWNFSASRIWVGPPGPEGFRPNLVVQSQQPDFEEEPETVARGELGVMKEKLPGFRLVSEGPFEARGAKGYLLEFEWRDAGVRSLHQWQLHLAKNGVRHVATATCLAAQVEELSSLFLKVLKSISVGSPAGR
jgi:hypothetical protein